MATYTVPIVKGKGSLKVDAEKIGDEYFAYVVQMGLKAILNRLSKVKSEDYSTDEAFQQACMAEGSRLLECLYKGEGIRLVGMAKAKTKSSDRELMTEARRIAREIVKSQILAAGEKPSHYSVKDITAAANALIDSEQGDDILAEAKTNLEERKAKAEKSLAKFGKVGKVDLGKMTKVAKKTKAKGDKPPLSAKQAAIPAKHGKEQHATH